MGEGYPHQIKTMLWGEDPPQIQITGSDSLKIKNNSLAGPGSLPQIHGGYTPHRLMDLFSIFVGFPKITELKLTFEGGFNHHAFSF